MKRFKNILVVVGDDSELKGNAAITRGAELAQKNNARLTLMDVIKAPEEDIKAYKGIVKAEELIAMFVSQREKELSEAAALCGEGIETEVLVKVGRDFIEIVRQVLFGQHDLVIKVANEHPENFDSSDFHLMRKCPRPVWLLHPGTGAQCKKILAAVDLAQEGNEEGKALNKLIMDLATSLAQWQNSELHVMSCWSLYGETSLRYSSFVKVSDERLQEILAEEEARNQAKFDQLLDRYAGHAIRAHLVKGDPVYHIPLFTDKNDVDLVVMGTVARSGIPGLLIGNTAETVLNAINSSVMTVKPGGFETPIK